MAANRVATVDQRGHHVRPGQPHAGVAAGQQQGDADSSTNVHADVGAQPRHVAAAVVDAEPEPAGQPGQRGLGLNRRVQFGDQAADVGVAADAAGQRRRDDVADPLMGRRRQQARAATISATAAGR